MGEAPAQMEFLIDRFGYARALWLPEDAVVASKGDWHDINVLLQQIELPEREPLIRPPPDEHVH